MYGYYKSHDYMLYEECQSRCKTQSTLPNVFDETRCKAVRTTHSDSSVPKLNKNIGFFLKWSKCSTTQVDIDITDRDLHPGLHHWQPLRPHRS